MNPEPHADLDPTTLLLLEDFTRDRSLWPILMGRLEDLDRSNAMEALKWAVENDKCPNHTYALQRYWWWVDNGQRTPPLFNHLPSSVSSKLILDSGVDRRIIFDSLLDAWHWLLTEWNRWDWPRFSARGLQ